MARKKPPSEETASQPADAPAPTSPTTVPGDAAEPSQNGNGGDKRKPLVSYRLSSDRTTSIELAVWSNTLRNQQSGEEYEQLSITVQRSYKTDAGWQRQDKPSWRAHDIPCLLHLLGKAHAF